MKDEEVFLEKTNEFARKLSYQIKQNLIDIYLSNDILRKDSEDDFPNDIISRNLYKIDMILSEFLVATGSPDLEKESVKISSLLNKIRTIFSNKMEQNGVVVKEGFVNGDSIFADEQKLQDSLVNIISNALEALPKENGKIDISASKKDQTIEIDIHDNGMGINQEDALNVFDPFFSTKTGRLGLSLTYSKNIILAHDGEISLNSYCQKGTLVKIKLPLEKD